MNMIQVGIATVDIMLYIVCMALLLCRFESMRAYKKMLSTHTPIARWGTKASQADYLYGVRQ